MQRLELGLELLGLLQEQLEVLLLEQVLRLVGTLEPRGSNIKTDFKGIRPFFG